MTTGDQKVIIATRKGMAIRFREQDVRSMGRQARGVRAIRLNEGDEVVGMCVVEDDSLVLTVSETGYGRLSYAENYRLTSRGVKGVINYHTAKYGEVAAIRVVDPENDDVIMVSSDGVIIRILASSIRICARPSKGVTIMKVKEGNKVVACANVPHDETEEATALEAEAIDPAEEAEDLAEDTSEETAEDISEDTSEDTAENFE